MPGYINKARHKYQHPMPKRPVNAPAKFKPIQYGAKVQTADVAQYAYYKAQIGVGGFEILEEGCQFRFGGG